jgi:dephospho-CoA kinase
LKAPLIAVTGPIASGKTTVAKIMAERGGEYVDADALAHEVLGDPSFASELAEEFGPGILTGGRISRLRLAGIVFQDQKKLDRLNSMIRPRLKSFVRERLMKLAETAEYIVLDAVLFLQYKFRFKADLVVLTDAPEEVRIKRMMRRNGFDREEAVLRIERQRDLYAGWEKAGVRIDTDVPMPAVRKEAERIRDAFLEEI